MFMLGQGTGTHIGVALWCIGVALLHDSIPARFGLFSQPLVHDTTAYNFSLPGVPTRLLQKYNIRPGAVPSGSFSSVWHDLASLDEVVKGGTGDVQDLGN